MRIAELPCSSLHPAAATRISRHRHGQARKNSQPVCSVDGLLSTPVGHELGCLLETDRIGPGAVGGFRNRPINPSAVVGCVQIVSRRTVYGMPPRIAVW